VRQHGFDCPGGRGRRPLDRGTKDIGHLEAGGPAGEEEQQVGERLPRLSVRIDFPAVQHRVGERPVPPPACPADLGTCRRTQLGSEHRRLHVV